MATKEEVEAYFQGGFRAFMPHHSVDCVVFGFHDGELKILLVEWRHIHQWSLPGGAVRYAESLDDAAHRILADRTGLREVFLEQFHTFGGLARREQAVRDYAAALGIQVPEDFWPGQRVISTGYYALVDFSTVTPTTDFVSRAGAWWNIQERPPLLFDHDEMVDRALQALRHRLHHQPIGLNLLPETFTMPELRRLYETILGRALDRRNFQRKMLASGVLERVGQRQTGAAHRSPYLYRFNLERYHVAFEHTPTNGF